MNSAYDINQILSNEAGWLFYSAAIKNWRVINSYMVGPNILDVGCAGGISMALSRVFNPSWRFQGFEGEDSAREIWSLRNLEVSVGNIYKLPFEDASFDTVFTSHVLEHLVDPKAVLRECARVSRRRIIHSVPIGNVDDKNHGSPHLQYFDRINFIELFSDLKLDIVTYTHVADTHMSSLILVADLDK